MLVCRKWMVGRVEKGRAELGSQIGLKMNAVASSNGVWELVK